MVLAFHVKGGKRWRFIEEFEGLGFVA